jgi:TetR/AcrR family transcriptional regulator, mexJK operon transcriptional repressor
VAEVDAPRRGRPGGSSGRDLLDVARQVFLAHGFAGATMDVVAARARISKQTLYRQFASKDALFAAVVRDWVDRGHDAMRPHTRALLEATDIREGLLALARILQAGVLSRPVLQMRTLVAAEAERFPEVAADYVARSWDRNQRLLAEALVELADRGRLAVDAADVAAEQFTWLVLAAPLNRMTLRTGGQPYGDRDLDAIATEAVTTFLSRFGPDAGPAAARR